MNDPSKRSLPAVVAAASVLVFLLFSGSSVIRKGNAYDEVIDIAAGYGYLRTGTYRLCPEHPALATTLTALPLLLLDLPNPSTDAGFAPQTRWNYAFRLVHRSPADPRTLLVLARLPSLLLSAALVWGVYLFGRREFSDWGGAFAAVLLATSPAFAAHSALVGLDSYIACLVFAAMAFTIRCLDRPSWGRIALAGVAIGAALGAKPTALLLAPAALVVGLSARPIHAGRWWEATSSVPRRLRVGVFRALPFAALGAVALAFLWVLYAPAEVAGGEPGTGYLIDPRVLLPQHGPMAAALDLASAFLPQDYGYGIRAMVHSEAERGWPMFLFGRTYEIAPAWAYPLVALIKSRTVVLLVFPLGLALAIGRPEWRRRLLQLSVFPALLLLVLATGKGYHGTRIVLVCAPFLLLVLGAGLGRWAESVGWRRWTAVGAVALAALSGLAAWRDPLAYQSALAGPDETAHERLVDSDLDWGQDLPALSAWLRERGNPPIHLRYFGTDDPDRYGIRYEPLGCDPVAGLLAISATSFQGLYAANPACFEWLGSLAPIARPGGSILVFDTRDLVTAPLQHRPAP